MLNCYQPDSIVDMGIKDTDTLAYTLLGKLRMDKAYFGNLLYFVVIKE